MGSSEEYIVITSGPIGGGSSGEMESPTLSDVAGNVSESQNTGDSGSIGENIEYVEALVEPLPNYTDVLNNISITLDGLFILLAFLAGMFFFRCFGK